MKAIIPIFGLLLVGCHQPDQTVNNDYWKPIYPEQYQSWKATDTQDQRDDVLAEHPKMVVLWAGTPYSKQFNSPRGHRFAVADVSHTLRTGTVKEGENQLSASCWSCKTPNMPELVKQMGEAEFTSSGFHDVAPKMANTIGCADCHQGDNHELAITRPHAIKAMAKNHQPFEKQDHNWQGAQTCGQCHVTYYFQSENHNKVNIPWIFGSTAEEILKYYDTRRYYEWLHPISQAPMLKARHPEYETWSRSDHAKQGVTCVSCHMAPTESDDGQPGHSHQVTDAISNFDSVCSACHDSESALTQQLADNKARISTLRDHVETQLLKAHFDAQAAWKAGANWSQMSDALVSIRRSQWYWDFAIASHGIHAHNPKEALADLNTAMQLVEEARLQLGALHRQLKVAEVDYPTINSKAQAQELIGLNVEALTQEKQRYIESEVAKHWPEAAMRGY
ncbi:ammonia-forming cytochrome c nitrite reductase subunit c552 [Ferrimonas aestuarii]|uniref:nitrite reductase (cytochrome; ammonia-forming) n=1 Tax=Ferrimonas aestuarii TaxID=2569539 RepID=A0A4U1BMC2_9GAMM|nr:ammonia-forming cytochrome c nitrite reductase subunit c552 [Ferrimonas aestuarii]TKB54315.1 ammonia-forming cytochrome c nitrite reductase subunit c552 [Ferrimonas aestuarii]